MHKDPADQIVVASTLISNAYLMTNDRAIKDSGLVEVL